VRGVRSVIDGDATVDLVFDCVRLASHMQLLNRGVRKAHSGAARVFWTGKLNNVNLILIFRLSFVSLSWSVHCL